MKKGMVILFLALVATMSGLRPCRAQDLSLPGIPEFHTFQTQAVDLVSALAAYDTNTVQDILFQLCPLHNAMSDPIRVAGLRVNAALKLNETPDGFDFSDYIRMRGIAERANDARGEALRSTMSWLDFGSNQFADISLQIWELSQHADSELARLLPPLMTNLLAGAVPPYLDVDMDVPDSIPAGETVAIRVEVRNVGDTTASNVVINFSPERQDGDGLLAEMGSLGPTQKMTKTFFLTFPDQDLAATFIATAISDNTPESTVEDFTIVETNCASGP